MTGEVLKKLDFKKGKGLIPVVVQDAESQEVLMLAYANDCGYETIFAEQLDALADPGDILVVFSGSGRSPNVIRALDLARQRDLTTIGFTGRDGGDMRERCDICLIAPCQAMEHIEDVHVLLCHLIYSAIRDQAAM